MRKIWFGLFGLIITTGAIAADLCVRNDAMVVAMNPTINATSSSSTAWDKGFTWSAQFTYGKLSGISGCHNYNTALVAYQEATNQNLTINSIGAGCYCKMLRPVESKWFYSGAQYTNWCCDSAAQVAACRSYCAGECAKFLANQFEFRRVLFQSLNNAD